MRVALFITCLNDLLFPNVGEAVVRLLRRHGCQVEFPMGQTCCGQPAFNAGYQEEARRMAAHWVKTFQGADYIVTPSGSCAAMVRSHYPTLLPESREIASRTFEFCEFMVDVLGLTDIGAEFPARATYHHSCHMKRDLKLVEQPLTLLRHVKGLELVTQPHEDLCCGFGGTFAVKMAGISEAMVTEKAACVTATGAEVLIGSDSSCLMNLGGRLQRESPFGDKGRPVKIMHTAEVLWEGVKGRG